MQTFKRLAMLAGALLAVALILVVAGFPADEPSDSPSGAQADSSGVDMAMHRDHSDASWPEVKWEALMPTGWDPSSEFKGLDLSRLKDSDPRAIEVLDRIKKVWDDAPANLAMNGKAGRIAGFAIPLERQGDKVTEFLIVPYFGACIHTPPPPANQIIHARSSRPLSGIESMMPIWSYGTFSVQRGETAWGVAGYRMKVHKIARYEDQQPKTE